MLPLQNYLPNSDISNYFGCIVPVNSTTEYETVSSFKTYAIGLYAPKKHEIELAKVALLSSIGDKDKCAYVRRPLHVTREGEKVRVSIRLAIGDFIKGEL